MKKSYKVLVLALFSICFNGCTTYGHLEADPFNQSQEVGVDNGNPYILSSQKNNIAITVPQTFKSDDRMRVFIRVINGEDEPFFFNPSLDITADVADTEDMVPLHIYSEEELVSEVASSYGWDTFGAGLFGLLDVMPAENAGYSTVQGTYDGYYEGRVGRSYYGGNYGGTWEATTYDPYKAEQERRRAQAESNARFARLESEYNGKLDSIRAEIIKPMTLPPNESCWGQIEIDSPKVNSSEPNYLWFNVITNKETHRIRFKVTKEK